MLNTVFLEKEDESSKTYFKANVKELSSKIISPNQRRIMNTGIMYSDLRRFFFSDGSVELPQVNSIYCVEFIPLNTEMLLPKNPKLLDWVLLYYDQMNAALDVSFEKTTKIKLLGNKNRIMGLDEPLLCDMPFMSLRLIFMGEIEGWVVC